MEVDILKKRALNGKKERRRVRGLLNKKGVSGKILRNGPK